MSESEEQGDQVHDAVSINALEDQTADTLDSDSENAPSLEENQVMASTNLADHLKSASTVQYTYSNGSNVYTVSYSLASGNVVVGGDTPIRDKDGKDLDIMNLKGIKVTLGADFKDEETITTDQIFTYQLPTLSPALTWSSSGWIDLADSDGKVLGAYKVDANGLVQVKFNSDFIRIDNRFASVSLEATFDGSGYQEDKAIRFVFEGIGTFVGTLKAKKELQIQKRDANIKVDSTSDIPDVFANHVRTSAHSYSSYNGSNYPYIELTDDGQYITQILKVTATGNHTNVVIEDNYGGSRYVNSTYIGSNDWIYDSTVALVKVAADGTTSTLSDSDYTLTDANNTVTWTLNEELGNGDIVYVAYRAKLTGSPRSYTSYSSGEVQKNADGNIERTDYTVTYSREIDVASVKSDESAIKYDQVNNYLYYFGTNKACINLDTVNKEATWVVYYNLGNNYTMLDGINIKDVGAQGALSLVEDSVTVSFLESGDHVQYISSSDVYTKGIKLVEDGQAINSAWSEFTSQYMTSGGFTIPEGTGYGALRIEFKTTYDKDKAEATAKGDAEYITNTAYWGTGTSHAIKINVADLGNVWPATFSKTATFAPNSKGVANQTSGLIKWTSTFRLAHKMKLEYRDGMRNGQRLALDNEAYPMTITYHDGSPGAVIRTIEKYEEGVSADEDGIYYILTVYDDADKSYVTSNGTKDKPTFTIKFVDKNGEEVVLDKGNYEITYYSYFSPLRYYSYNYRSYDVGNYYYYSYEENYAWLVYNNEKNYMQSYASRTQSRNMYKGSDMSGSSFAGDNRKIPNELAPKAANELYWWFSIDPLTETTSKVVLRDEFNVGAYTNADGERHTYADAQTLQPDRFVVYNGDTKLDSSQYTLEETDQGFNLTVAKEDGYDPLEALTVYYMTKIDTEQMVQGEKHYYGNKVYIDSVYDEALSELNDEETKFYKNADAFYNGDYQDYTYDLLTKGDEYDAATQYIVYTLNVNPYELALNDGNAVELTDEMDANLEYDVDGVGNFIVPIQILDKYGNAIPSTDYEIDLEEKEDGTYGPLKITVPDGESLKIKYRVRVKTGLFSLTDIEASNSVRFSTGDYTGLESTDVVKLTNLNAAAGGTPVYLTIQKNDAGDEQLLLDGAEYEVTVYNRKEEDDGSYSLVQKGSTTTQTTQDGVFAIKTSYGSVVKVKEVKAPTGYEIDDDTEHYYLVERAKDGTKDQWKSKYESTFLGDVDWDKNVELFTTNRPKAIFEDSRITETSYQHDSFTLTKYDVEDGETLSGAEYTIYSDESATKPVKVDDEDVTVTTQEDGSVTLSTDPENDGVLSKLVPKAGESLTYYIKESKAPDGYVQSDEVRSFTISADEESEWNTDHTIYKVLVTYTIKTDNLEDTSAILVEDMRNRVSREQHNELIFEKKDAQDDAVLANAEFTIYADEAMTDVVITYTTDSDGTFRVATDDEELASVIPSFEADADTGEDSTTLYLKETKAPDGYVLDDTIHELEVGVKRISEWQGEKEDRAYVTTTTYSIEIGRDDSLTVKDDRIYMSEVNEDSLLIEKVDTSGTALSGAEFTLYADESGAEVITTITAGRVYLSTTDEVLKAYLPAFDDDQEGTQEVTVYLKETKAPDGYELDDTMHPIKLEAVRTSDWNDAHDAYVTTTTYTISSDDSHVLRVVNEKSPSKDEPSDEGKTKGKTNGKSKTPGKGAKTGDFGILYWMMLLVAVSGIMALVLRKKYKR